MVKTGLSAVIGSWKMSAISPPRTDCISRSESPPRSRPLYVIRPDSIRPGGSTSRMIENAVSDLPLPDSPTRPSVSPGAIEKLTSRTAGVNRPFTSKPVVRCSTARSGASDIDLGVLPEYRSQGVRDLTDGGMRFHRLDDHRDQIVRAARRDADRLDGCPP